MTDLSFDVVVIGAGVVGAAIARDLGASSNTVALLDAGNDVCSGTSKANTAILHTGYDAKPGTLEARLVARGYELTWDYVRAAGIGCDRIGAILVAWDAEQAESLPSLQQKAVLNGYLDTRLLSAAEVYSALPKLGAGVCGGLEVPGESVIDPWSVPLGYATDAVSRGAELLLGRTVTGISVGPEHTRIATTAGTVRTRWVLNAAGLGGGDIDAMFGHSRLVVHPRRGELVVYDKLAARLVDRIVLAAPSKAGKGVLISPTVFGNVMLGPTADDIEDRQASGTTAEGLRFLLGHGERILPELLNEEVTASYAGLRAAHNLPDYLIEVEPRQRYAIAAGIRSTGLTSALAVSEHLMGLLAGSSLDPTPRPELPPTVKLPPLGQSQQRPYQDDALISADPAYGEVMCFCERVTRGEIRDAMDSALPPTGLDGLRRRTRAMNGRCQGFFCGAAVQRLFDQNQEG